MRHHDGVPAVLVLLATPLGILVHKRGDPFTPPGLEPWNVRYEQASATSQTGAGDRIDSNGGRLTHLTRSSLVEDSAGVVQDNVTSVVYDVPLSVSKGGPYNLGPDDNPDPLGRIDAWGQLDAPVAATAVFPPDQRSRDNRLKAAVTATATTPGSGGYDEAEVHYLNAAGLEVNTASPKGPGASAHGFIDTTEYNKYGSPTRTLDATNRLLALLALDTAPINKEAHDKALGILEPLGLAGRSSRDIANALDSRKGYSADGLELLYELGPTQRLALDNDPTKVASLRSVTVNRYDEQPDAPIGGVKYHQVTTAISGAVAPDAAVNAAGTYDSAALQDARAITYKYSPIDGADKLGGSSGWVHKQPTSVTVDAGQPTALTSTVLYDARGRVLRSSKPGSNGTDAATTTAVFYTAGANDEAACGNQPVWAGHPCVTRAAGPVTGHDAARMSTDLPVKRVTGYNAFGSPTVTTDTVGTGAAQVVRTATTEYDAADRVDTVAMSTTGPLISAPVATLYTEYDADTGEVTENRSVDAKGAVLTVTKEYDRLGRLKKYTDAHGGWTTTTYDRYGQPHTVTDSIGTTRTYTYDRALDHRGYVTKLEDSVAGEIVPTWGPDGQLESQTLPGGVRLSIEYDASRVPTARWYTDASDGSVITYDTVVENHRGQWISHKDAIQGTSTYTYDRLGRLTGADHSPTGAKTCISRRYGYDQHTNRTSLTTATGAFGAACPGAAGGTVTTSTYDSADRLVSTSDSNGQAWTYDALGRITAMPTADGTGVAATGYFVNDLVASQEVPRVEKATWSLDPLHRFSTQDTFAWVPGVDGTGSWANSVEQVIHYDGDSDEPGWIVEDKTQPDKISRWVEGADGQTALQTGKSGDRVLQLVNLHGDVVGTLPIANGTGDLSWPDLQLASFDEFGNPVPLTSAATTNAPPARYGWLGAAQRSADTPAGVLLMGVRLYHPTTGRFLQVDPVAGGSANAYDYCNADPINCTDLGGTFTWKGLVKAVAAVGEVASMIPGPIGAAAGAVSAVAYAASGNKGKALLMGVTAAAALVGAGAAVKAVSIAAKTGRLNSVVTRVQRVVARSRKGC